MDRMIGRYVGPYRLKRVLGQGGMGTVYHAVHRGLRRPRALKLFLPQVPGDQLLLERFRQEAILVSVLRHPNIVHTYDFGEQNGYYYIAMKLVAGTSLMRIIQQEGALPLPRALQLLAQLADALDYAHERGVVHRDLKASNVIVGLNDQLTLVDFGLAAVIGGHRLTQTGLASGTPEYMAPEVLSGAEPGPAADFYGLGILAYQMLTGRVPFQHSDVMQVLHAQVHTMPPSPRRFRADLPLQVEAVVLKQLSKHPAQRYAKAGSFVMALTQAVGRLPASTPVKMPPAKTAPAGRYASDQFVDALRYKLYAPDAVKTPRPLLWPVAGAISLFLLLMIALMAAKAVI